MNGLTERIPVAAALLVLAGMSVHGLAQAETPSESKTPSEAETPSVAETPSKPGPPIEDLGDERYRIGTITVDKAGRSFTVPGKILHLKQPLEYLAVKRNGGKGYESLLELDVLAVEFQLACILVGLDDRNSVKPRFQYDEREPEGQALDITLSWDADDEAKTVKAASALMAGDTPFDDHAWVYIGSMPSSTDGSLLAEASGTLIGFVHDPLAVIEHRKGARAGSYGLMTGNAALLPPEGAPVTVTVSVITEKSAASQDDRKD